MSGKAVLEILGEDKTATAWRSAVGHANESAERIKGLFEKAFVGVSVAAIAEVGLQAIEMGDNLNKAAIKAGVAGKTMSELAYVAKMADVDLQSLSTGLKFMQKNLSEAGTGSEKANGALDALGVSLQTIKSLSPDQQFEMLADRISKLQDPADKARAATELFGKAGADLLPMFEQGAAGIRKAREEAQQLGIALTNDQIKRLAEADDNIKQMKASWSAWASTLVAEVAPAITAVFKPFSADQQLEQAKAQLDSLEHGFDEVAKAALRAKIAQLEAVTAVKPDAGAFASAMAPGVSNPQGYAKRDDAEIKRQNEARIRENERAAKEMEKEKEKARVAAFDAMLANLFDQLKYEDDAAKASVEYDKAALKMREMNLQQTLQEMFVDWEDYYQKQHKLHDDMSIYAEQAARNMQDAFANFLFDPFKGGLKGMLAGFVDTMRRMVAEAAASSILKSIFGEGKDGNGNGLGSFLGSIFGGFRAGGGPVSAGRAYVVGEKQPEIFVPGTSGTIVPKVAASGGGNVTVNINAPNSTRESVNDLRAMVPAIVQAAVQQSRAQIRDDISRGEFRR